MLQALAWSPRCCVFAWSVHGAERVCYNLQAIHVQGSDCPVSHTCWLTRSSIKALSQCKQPEQQLWQVHTQRIRDASNEEGHIACFEQFALLDRHPPAQPPDADRIVIIRVAQVRSLSMLLVVLPPHCQSADQAVPACPQGPGWKLHCLSCLSLPRLNLTNLNKMMQLLLLACV